MIEKQQQTIKELECGEIEERKKADLIYQNYELINKILEELRKAIEKYDWNEVENRLKGHKLIKAFSPRDKTIAIEI